MNKTVLGLVVGLSIALSACSSMPSKPRTIDQLGQFSSYPLNAQSFRVSFKTNQDMSYGTAEEITLVKAAQTTVKNGFRYFKVENDPSNRSQHPARQAIVYTPPPPPMFYPYRPHRRGGYWYDPFYNMSQPQIITVDPAEVSYTITCYKTQQEAPSDAFDATIILRSLGAKYGLTPFGDILAPQATTKAS